ncbi:cytochrome P450 [Xylaria digitata]|nr:cytochrome P450 [Xylaria digitata]
MFPWVFNIIEKIPMSVLAVFDRRFLGADKFDKEIGAQIKEVLKTDELHIGIKNVFHEMHDSKQLPPEDKYFSYYKSEAASFVAAGTETTASALTTLTYFVLANPDILHTLREELKTVMPSSLTELPPISTLENLPYLLHTDEKVFPEPFEFKPERWVNDTDFNIRRHFVAFSRGARGCIGINLAYAELYPAVAAFFSRFELKLYKTSGRDVEFASDRFISHRPEGSQRVRVQVVSAT